MPLPGQPALTDIYTAKELTPVAYQPVCFAELTLIDGSVLRMCEENFVSTDGGIQFLGFDWLPRIQSQNLGMIQAVSDNGIVQSPSIELVLADADKEILTQWEMPDGMGLKGAKLRLLFAFWDCDAGTFSVDSTTGGTQYMVKFVGICSAPDFDELTLTIQAENILNLSRKYLPTTRIGRTCPWVFPTNKAERVIAAVDEDCDQFPCGYSPDVTDGDAPGGTAAARGNTSSANQNNPDGTARTDANGVYVSCDYSFASCIARLGDAGLPAKSTSSSPVQIERDTSNRPTGRFGGIQYDPPLTWRGNAFISGTKTEGINQSNQAKYNDYFPMIYGTTFVEPPVMNVLGDPNTTRMEVALCVGQIHTSNSTPGPVTAVIVNDYVVPHITQTPDPTSLAWFWINTGARNGGANRLIPWNGQGDPYGNIAAIAIVVPVAVAASNSVPNVRVLTNGPLLRNFTAANVNSFTRDYTTNPVWQILDLLTWCGLRCTTQQNDFDLQPWLDSAGVCVPQVTYTDLTGTSRTHDRYKFGFSIRERRTAAEIIKNLLAGCKGVLMPNLGLSSDPSAGLLQMYIRQTLADQQPGRIPGSNNNTSISSAHADGTNPVPGFVAYAFDQTNILRKGPGRNSPTTLRFEQRKIQDTPNRMSISFQDEDYFYNNDGVEVVDSGDIGRIAQEITGGTVAAEGVTNWDQAKRILQGLYFQQYRGNPRTGFNGLNDSGGTWIADFWTSFKGIHLKVSDVITIDGSFLVPGLVLWPQLFRVTSIKADPNFERINVRAEWHEDDPYLDSYGQRPDPILEQQLKNKLRRPPFGWSPNYISPQAQDTLFNPTEKTFGIAQAYETAADGSAIASLQVTGHTPVNAFSGAASPPYAPQATTATGGGTIPDGSYHLAICGIDANGQLTAPSNPIAQITCTGGGTSTITVPNIFYPQGNVGYKLYAGTNPNKLSLQATAGSTPASITLATFKISDEEMPDVMLDRLRWKIKHVIHSGVFGAIITGFTSTTITIDDNGFAANIWTGRNVSILGQPNSTDDLPVWDFLVASNTTDTFTLAAVGGVTPNLTTLGMQIGDVLIMRAQSDIFTASTIGDSLFINPVDYFDPPIAILDASNTTPITITLGAPGTYVTNDEVFVQGVFGNDGANGVFLVTQGADPFHYDLQASTPTGDYAGGGTVTQVTNGLEPHAEANNLVRIISGTGRGQIRKITDNTNTTLTVEPDWDVVPDATSVFIVEEEAWLNQGDTTPIHNTDPANITQFDFPIANYLDRVLWAQIFSVSADNRESVAQESPGREIYVFGADSPASDINFETIQFNVKDSTVHDDAFDHVIVKRGFDLVDWDAEVKVTPTTDFVVDFLVNGVLMLSAPITIPAGTLPGKANIISGNGFATSPMHLSQKDIVTGNITASDGAADPYGLITITFKGLLT